MGGSTIIVTTGNDVEGKSVVGYLGVVRGIVVRSPNLAQGFLGGLNSIIGGNIQAYQDVCERARRDAYDLMVEHAIAMGADGIIGMRYDATEFTSSVTEVLAYGTAVRLR